MDNLTKLENKSIHILREAYANFKELVKSFKYDAVMISHSRITFNK